MYCYEFELAAIAIINVVSFLFIVCCTCHQFYYDEQLDKILKGIKRIQYSRKDKK